MRKSAEYPLSHDVVSRFYLPVEEVLCKATELISVICSVLANPSMTKTLSKVLNAAMITH